MRTISVNHRDGRGRVAYYVYETVDGLVEEMPNANATDNLANALEGDYVIPLESRKIKPASRVGRENSK